MNKVFGYLCLVCMASVISCKTTDSPEPSAETGSLKITFENKAGAEPLVFGNDYVNDHGDTVRFSMFNYFISNISLTKEDGSVWTQPYDSSYYLIRHNIDSTRSLIIPGVPAGNYTSVSFTIGVDSAKSVSGIDERKGALDPAGGALGMYWQWNSGYIFLKVEGTSPQAPVNTMLGERAIIYHIGGFGGFTKPSQNNIKKATLAFPSGSKATVGQGTPELHIAADILKIFTPNPILVSELPVVMDGKFAPYVADNYSYMFSVSEVHN